MARRVLGVSATWPSTRAPDPAIVPTDRGRSDTTLYPIPPGRGRWRFALHERQFTDRDWESTLITEIVGARGVRLERAWCAPAKLTLTLDGHHPSTAMIEELRHDIFAWRWDETTGVDRCMFRGIVAQALDEVTEQSHTVNFVCHDYLEMLGRRFLTDSYYCEQRDQDNIVADLIERAKVVRASSGAAFTPGSYLPIRVETVYADGSPRGNSEQLRDRAYQAQSNIAELLDNLAAVIGGFDYDLVPAPAWPGGSGCDVLRVFHPFQGVTRNTPLVYGTTVAGFTRSTNAANYANYWRTLGHALDGGSDDDPTQLFAESWNDDVNDVDRLAVGTWMGADNAADVSDPDTLQEKADGNIETSGQLVATWTVKLRPGRYYYGTAEIGDVVPLVIHKVGRLDTETTIRILGLNYAVGTDGDEDIEVAVGRPTASLMDVLTRADRDVDAIARRDIGASGPDAPVGSMFYWPGEVPPHTWAWADGRNMSVAQYPDLFDVIGFTFGGALSVFNLPDCRGRMIVGAGHADRPPLTNRPRGHWGGAETVTLTAAHTPSHTHPVGETINAANADLSGTTFRVGVLASTPAFSGPNGGDQPHENMPPWLAIGVIIRVNPPLRPQRRRARA